METPAKDVVVSIVDVEGKKTRHVLHPLHAHQLSTHILIASGKARDPRNADDAREVA